MLLQTIYFELRQAYKKPATYIYAGTLFILGFATMNLIGGAFDSTSIMISGDNLNINSPYIIDLLLSLYNYLGIFIFASVVIGIIYKDFRYDTLSTIFTTPITKTSYILGRFFSAFIINLVIFSTAALGLMLGSVMPYLEQSMFGDFLLSAYTSPFLSRIIPNIFFLTAIFFTLTLLFRSQVINWLSIIGLYILYFIGTIYMSDADHRLLSSLIDPFGFASSVQVQVGAGTEELNNEAVQLVDVYLYNRLLWTSVGIILLVIAFFRFKFSFLLRSYSFKKPIKTVAIKKSNAVNMAPVKVKTNFGRSYYLKGFLNLFLFETQKLLKNTYFVLIFCIGLAFLYISSLTVGKIYDTNTYPVTYQVIEVFKYSLTLFITVIIILFSGELVWKERQLKISESLNVLPTKNWMNFGSKFLALSTAVVIMLGIMIIAGLLVQISKDYYHFEIALYLKSVLGIQLIDYLLLIVLAFAVQIIVNHKYVGYFVMVFYVILDIYVADSLLQHNLLTFGRSSGLMYSDMNGFGYQVWPYLIFKSYWISFAIILSILSNQLWVNSFETGFKSRFMKLKESFASRNVKWALLGSFTVFIIIGSYIFYNTNILNDYQRSYSFELQAVKYEKKYKQYEQDAQPKISKVKIHADLYPKNGDLTSNVSYTLKNKSNQAIDSVHVLKGELIENLKFNRAASLVLEDDVNGYYIYKLAKALKPNENLKMDFSLISEAKGFSNNGVSTYVDKNGTFMYNSSFPSIGYDESRELFGKRIRKKHNLADKAPALKINDPKGIRRNIMSYDADFIQLEAIISTSADQTAIVPGYLQEQWTENGRNYFHYKMERKMINYYPILSAKYEVAQDLWIPKDSLGEEVKISVYYHKGHEYNVDKMIASVKQSLSFYSENFSPYQYNQLRIIEFPRFGSFAQSFPNTIPFSEGIGFIADLRDLDKEDIPFDEQLVDYPFYVTAHEMAHQWWAHQVIPANVEGAQMIQESFSQLSAMKVMESYYGKEKMKKFIRSELQSYLVSRGKGSFDEQPLKTVYSFEQSNYYNKGAVVLYALNDILGENRVLKSMKYMVEQYAFKSAPFPTTEDFITHLKANSPHSLHYFITDCLEKITFYKYDVKFCNYNRKRLDYFVDLKLDASKLYSDGQGKETKAKMNDFIDIGIYDSKGEEIYMERHRVKDGENLIKLKLKRKPSEIILDPYYKLISKEFTRSSFKIDKI